MCVCVRVHALKTKHSRLIFKRFLRLSCVPIRDIHTILSEERESEYKYLHLSPSQTPPTAEETSDVPMETADSADPPPPPPTN